MEGESRYTLVWLRLIKVAIIKADYLTYYTPPLRRHPIGPRYWQLRGLILMFNYAHPFHSQWYLFCPFHSAQFFFYLRNEIDLILRFDAISCERTSFSEWRWFFFFVLLRSGSGLSEDQGNFRFRLLLDDLLYRRFRDNRRFKKIYDEVPVESV